MDSVRQSRRTLMVVSPDFVCRNWCHFEFQTAVAEMIEEKHRILPVIFGDLKLIKHESTMCATLRRVLNTVTYLEYPGDSASDQDTQKFWRRLELSMPKKKTRNELSLSSPTSSCISSPTSVSNEIPFYRECKNQSTNQLTEREKSFLSVLSSPPKDVDSCSIHVESSDTKVNNTSAASEIGNSPVQKPQRGILSWFRGRKIVKNSQKLSFHSQLYSPSVGEYRQNGSGLPESKNGIVNAEQQHNSQETADSPKVSASQREESNQCPIMEDSRPTQIVLSDWSWPVPGDGHQVC